MIISTPGVPQVGDVEKHIALVSLRVSCLLKFLDAYVFARTTHSPVAFDVVSAGIFSDVDSPCGLINSCVSFEKVAISKFLFFVQMTSRLSHSLVDSSVGITNRVLQCMHDWLIFRRASG